MGWSVVKANLAAPVGTAASWTLFAQCSMASTIGATRRDNLNAAAYPGSFNHYYAVAQSESPLPIELLYFNAELKEGNVECTWETASETNNEFFDVERSLDGINFKSIGQVRGFGYGTSTEKRSYSFTDFDECKTIRYYRLRQQDIDGKFSYSDAIAINCRRISGIDVYPNPANTTITYQFIHEEESELIVNVVDIAGRVVYIEKIIAHKGTNTLTSRIDELAAGAYYLRISSSESDVPKYQVQFFKN
jgi:hypothetical protein